MFTTKKIINSLLILVCVIAIVAARIYMKYQEQEKQGALPAVEVLE